MSHSVTKTKIQDGGLRYKAKVSGSPFGETNQYSGSATMSCFLCGKHRPRGELMTRKFVGKTQNVCSPKCER